MEEVNNLLFDSSSEEEERQEMARLRRRKIYKERINFFFVNDLEFNERFRMSPQTLENLCMIIGNDLHHHNRGGALTARQQICIALHWLGSGGQYHTVADMHGISKATVCRCVKRLVSVVNRNLFHIEISWPDNIGDTISDFYQIAHFPHVMGVIDGILIPIDAPVDNEPAYVDRHGDHSINCMFVCGPQCRIFYVSARWPGSVHDSRVLRNSTLYERLEEDDLFPNALILGDSGYPLKRWLMVPCNENPNDHGERRYNRRLKATRQTIERCLGILKEKFPCLNHLRVEPNYAANIIKCCATLCNFARKGEEVIELLEVDGEQDENEPEVMVEEVLEADDQPVRGPERHQGVLRQREIINAMR